MRTLPRTPPARWPGNGPEDPADWQAVTWVFRDGHAGTWYAADATLGWWGPDGFTRLVVATADPGTLPDKATWYLAVNLPRPGGPHLLRGTKLRVSLATFHAVTASPGP